jgi:hypothetical protein
MAWRRRVHTEVRVGERWARELRTWAAAGSAACLLLAHPIRAQGAGELDPSFGVDGVIVSDLPHTGSANALLQQPDQSLVAVGVAVDPGGSWAYLERRDASGALDTTFGVGGRVYDEHDDAGGMHVREPVRGV